MEVLLEREGKGEEVRFVEVEGTHAQIVKGGVAVGKCVDVGIGALVQKANAKAKEGSW